MQERGIGVDPSRVAAWLRESFDPDVRSVSVTRMPGGHSSGAWRLDAHTAAATLSMVLKAPDETTLVFRRDACREARILQALHGLGAPVPAVIAMDCEGVVTGRPSFAMEYIEARSVDDEPPAGCHGTGWLRDSGELEQRVVWESFHDALSRIHGVDGARVPDARYGENGVVDFIDYWTAALLDVAPRTSVPRHLAVLDWLRSNVPPDADEAPALCMGDSRLANALIVGREVQALVDFEVAYVGNPAADIGYSLSFDAMQSTFVDEPLPGFPSAEDTWSRWSTATGRSVENPDYWTAFGATALLVTAARAMHRWGAAPETFEVNSFLLGGWEASVGRASG